ncbi:hypothetical protein P7K49_013154 [Saguinus oedipus]|uniref:Uncharacterized protein n=1 Tax=Saguinus oedipus TaxID=9490 RepID=A0ABQ9VF52_SAGOE|nr:hypothetical protein P7K49_013154 [Saguinus oedipus]
MQSRASSTADHSQTHTRSLTTRGLRSTTETPHGIRGRRLAPDDTHTPCGGARGSAGDSRSWPTGPLRHKPLVHRAGSDPGRGRRPARTDKIDSPWPTGPPRIREGTSGTTGKHLHGTKPPHTKAILTPFPAWDADWPSAPPRSPLTGPGPPPPETGNTPNTRPTCPGSQYHPQPAPGSETSTHPDLGILACPHSPNRHRTHSAVVAAGRASAREQADDHSPSLQATTSTQR